jgi:hypothetical protein
MGSQSRKLRVKAAAAGERYQAELRANARKVESARRLAEQAGSQVAVSSKYPAQASPFPSRFATEPSAPVLVGKPDARPPASAMALTRRMPLLAQVMLMSMMLAGVEPPKGDR